MIASELRVLELIKVEILKITNRATNKPRPFVLRRFLKDFVHLHLIGTKNFLPNISLKKSLRLRLIYEISLIALFGSLLNNPDTESLPSL